MELLGVHTVGGEDLGEDGLSEGDVVVAGGPVAAVLEVGAVSPPTGGIAGEVGVEAGHAGPTQRSHITAHIPAAPGSPVSHVVHPSHRHVEEPGGVQVGHVPPGHVDHLVVETPTPAVVVEDQGDGQGVGGVVLGGEVEAELPADVPLLWVRHQHCQPVVAPGAGLGGQLSPTAGAGGGEDEGEGGEEEHGQHLTLSVTVSDSQSLSCFSQINSQLKRASIVY